LFIVLVLAEGNASAAQFPWNVIDELLEHSRDSGNIPLASTQASVCEPFLHRVRSHDNRNAWPTKLIAPAIDSSDASERDRTKPGRPPTLIGIASGALKAGLSLDE